MTPSKMEEFLEVDEQKTTIQQLTPFEQGLKDLLSGYVALCQLDNLTVQQTEALKNIYASLQQLQVQDATETT